jgi:hypothetical protein
MRRPRTLFGLCGLLVIGCLGSGCGSKEIPDLPPEQVHILKLSSLLAEYRRTHKNELPKDAAAFKTWASSLKPDQLTKFGINNLDEALVSPRDHEPYQITPGKPNRMGIIPVIAYEKNGVNGKRYILSSMGNAGEVNEEAIRNSVPNYGG